MSSVRTPSAARLAGLTVATLAVTALTPLAAAQAVPADCATVLAPALAASDAQPGYSGHVSDVSDSVHADLTSAWNSALVRSGLHGSVTLNLVIAGVPLTSTSEIAGVTTTTGSWTTPSDSFASPAERSQVLRLLGKKAPLSVYSKKSSSADDVHAAGVWPSHDVAGFLRDPAPVSSTTPGPDGAIAYTCDLPGAAATFTVNGAGLLSQIAVTGVPSGSVSVTGHGLVAAARTALRAARASAHVRASGAPATETLTLDYTYAMPVIRLPKSDHTTTQTMYRIAVEAVHLRDSVRQTAQLVALAANAGRGPRHPRVTTADIRELAHVIVGGFNQFSLIDMRVGFHPGGVWIAATNRLTGEKVAYSVRTSHGTAKVSKVA
jgi:hypothetical protein